MKEKQLSMENMMLAQQTHQQQQLLQQQAQMQMYINTSIAYAQQQFNMQHEQKHMVSGWNAPTVVNTPASQILRAKTIDKHIKATVLQSDVPQYQEYSRMRSKQPRVIPSPASVFAKSRQMAETSRDEDDDDKPLAYLHDDSSQRSTSPSKGQPMTDPVPRKPSSPKVKITQPAKRPGQKPHRRSPLAEFSTVTPPPIPDADPNNGKKKYFWSSLLVSRSQNLFSFCYLDDIDYIIEMYQDFKVSHDSDQMSVVSTGSESQKSVFSWLKGNTNKKIKTSKQHHHHIHV
jgi:hypothetical protein